MSLSVAGCLPMSPVQMPGKPNAYGRDLGLSIRMLVTLLLVSGVYVGSAVVLLRVFVPIFVNSGAPVLLPLVVIGGVAVLLALVHTDAANSFATGFTPGTSTITRGLLDQLGPEELQAVLAHELSHIINRDGAVMTFAAVPATASAAISRRLNARSFILWAGFWWLVVLLKLYAGFTSTLMLILSRYREYAADRGAALLTGAPEQLMSALQKIAGAEIPSTDLRALDGVGCFCIVDSSGRPTHPPVPARLERLAAISRGMGHEPPPVSAATLETVDGGLLALTPYALIAALAVGAWIYVRVRIGANP